MKLREIYNKENSPVISFEFFPPKDDDDGQKTAALLNEISLLKKYNPGLVSVTYGAGGSTRHKSEELTKIINSKFELNVMPHFTCICSSRHDVDTRLETLTNAGIKNILALRGDVPADTTSCFQDFKHANELVSYVRSKSDFSIAVAGYPEGHIESPDLKTDIENLKKKVDAGADVIFTQLFFENEKFYNFVERVRSAGIKIPVAAGIMPIVSLKQAERILSVIKVKIPQKLMSGLERFADCSADIKKIGIEFASNQYCDLIKNNVDGIHFYTLNKSDAATKILNNNL